MQNYLCNSLSLLTQGSGGNIEVIPIGKRQAVAGEPRNGVAPSEIAYQTDLYMIKSTYIIRRNARPVTITFHCHDIVIEYGPVIKPALDPIFPLQALELQYAQGKNDEMLVLHILYTKIDSKLLTYRYDFDKPFALRVYPDG